jgi:predicted HNH restriction endonuclease
MSLSPQGQTLLQLLVDKIRDGRFTRVNGRAVGDTEWWSGEIRAAIVYDWSIFVNDTPPPTLPELIEFTRAVVEGRVALLESTIRTRCEGLRCRARQYYAGSDGRLKCEVCGWTKPDNRFSGHIVELHHIRPLADLPSDGSTLTLAEAIASLAPLCPNCHRCAHSRRGDRNTFTIEELKTMVPSRLPDSGIYGD